MTTSQQAQLLAYLDKHRSSFVEEWKHSISQLTTVVGQKGELDISESAAALLRRQGLATHLIGDEGAYVYGELPTGAPRTLLLCSQCAIQPSARWNMFVARLLALAAYQRAIGVPPVNIKWLVDIGGQRRGFTVQRLIEHHRAQLQADGCLYDLAGTSPFPSLLVAPGAKGLLSVLLEVQTNSIQSDSTYGAILPNAAWRLTWALNSLKDAREEILVEDFYDTLAPAEDEEIELLHSMPDSEQALARHLGVKNFLLQLQGFQLRYTQLLIPACTITSMSTGESAQETQHAIPSYARAAVDFHLVPNQEPDDIFAKLQKHLNAQGFQDVQVHMLSSRSPVQTALNNPFIQTVRRAALAAYEGDLSFVPLMPESVSLYALRSQLDIPVVITKMGYSEPELQKSNTFNIEQGLEQQEQQIIASIKHLAMIMEGMVDATRTTQ